MNKKGNTVTDSAMILALIFSIVLTVIILYGSVIKPLNDDIQGDEDFSTQAKAISGRSSTSWPAYWDAAVMILLVFLWAAALVTSQFIDSSPVFFVFALMGIIVVLIVAFSINDAYEDTITDGDYNGLETDFPKIHFLMQNIVFVIMLIAFSIAAALYGKG